MPTLVPIHLNYRDTADYKSVIIKTVTALISKEAVEDLKLQRGDKAVAVVKATEVMVAKE